MTHKAIEIASRIVSLSDPDIGDIISNLKIQKLLYYVQGFNLAIHGIPIFDEDIYAWQYGPVVKEVYNEFKVFGSGCIKPDDVKLVELSDDDEKLIVDVWDVYGQLSALRLMHLTHSEPPWSNTEINRVISHDKLKKYFLTQINEEN